MPEFHSHAPTHRVALIRCMEARLRREFPNNPPYHLASAETGSFSIPSRYHPRRIPTPTGDMHGGRVNGRTRPNSVMAHRGRGPECSHSRAPGRSGSAPSLVPAPSRSPTRRPPFAPYTSTVGKNLRDDVDLRNLVRRSKAGQCGRLKATLSTIDPSSMSESHRYMRRDLSLSSCATRSSRSFRCCSSSSAADLVEAAQRTVTSKWSAQAASEVL